MIFALLASTVAASASMLPLPARHDTLRIAHVTVIDVATGRHHSDQSIDIANGRVVRVQSSREARPVGGRVIDAQGKFAIPGLWDMHVHLSWPSLRQGFADLLVAHGITGVREMFGTIDDIRSWNAESARGAFIAPRMIGSGHIIDGSPPIWPGSVVVTDSAGAARAVDSLANAGASFIKIYNRVPPVAYRAIVAAAARRHIPVAGHLPEGISLWDAATHRQSSVEHLSGAAVACADSTALTRARISASSAGLDERIRSAQSARMAYSPTRCAALARRLRQQQVWQVPTLIVHRAISRLRDPAQQTDPRTLLLPPMLLDSWDWRKDFRFRSMSEAGWAEQRDNLAHLQRIVGLFGAHHAPMLAGTDTPNPYVFPGSSLHEELELLVASGLTPLQALQASTVNAAQWLAAEDTVGAIARGYVADLVLLRADPLKDIRGTREIDAVVLRGEYLSRSSLDSLVRDAVRRARPDGGDR